MDLADNSIVKQRICTGAMRTGIRNGYRQPDGLDVDAEGEKDGIS